MKILFVLHTWPPDAWGGTELHARAIARELSSEHEVRVFCRSSEPLAEQDSVLRTDDEGLTVTRFVNHFLGYRSFLWTYAYEPAHRAFVRELEDFRPDVVHVHHLTGLSATLIHACKRRGIPTVFSLHDFWTVCPRGQRLHPDGDICETIDRSRCHGCLGRIWPAWFPEGGSEEPENGIARWERVMAETLELADLVLTPSRFHRERMLEEVPLDPRRVVALPHGLDHAPFRWDHDPEPRPRVIGYIGSVVHTKGVHVLLEAFNILDDPDLELRIHGDTPAFHENAEYVALLRERARSRGAVRFLGHYDNEDLAELLRDVDILVVPSLWWETFSLTIRESMLAGVPVVASDIGAMREALEASGAGLLFRTGDPRDLARALRRLVDDPDLRRACSGHRDLVKTVRRNAEDYLGVYRKAGIIAEERRDRLIVNEPRFPQGGGRRRRRSQPRIEETPLRENPEDLRFSIEKIGEGEVLVQSAVERGKSTRVTFTFDYEPDASPSEVKLVIDFARKAAQPLTPAAGELPGADQLPEEADSGAAHMARSADADWDEQMRERAMYMLDDEIARDHASALDELVERSTLEEESAEEPPSPRRRRRSREEEPPAARTEREDGEPRRRRRGRRDEVDEAPPRRGDEEKPRRSRADSEDRPRRERRPRRDDDEARPARSREREPRRPRDEEREARPAARKRSEDSARPARDRSPETKEGGVVWNQKGPDWGLPEDTDPNAMREKPQRAPGHRLGRQPGLGGAEPGDFGSGI